MGIVIKNSPNFFFAKVNKSCFVSSVFCHIDASKIYLKIKAAG